MFETFFQDILSLTYFRKEIIKTFNEEGKKVYLENIKKNSNYYYPDNYIAIPRKWIPNKYRREHLKRAILKAFNEIS